MTPPIAQPDLFTELGTIVTRPGGWVLVLILAVAAAMVYCLLLDQVFPGRTTEAKSR